MQIPQKYIGTVSRLTDDYLIEAKEIEEAVLREDSNGSELRIEWYTKKDNLLTVLRVFSTDNWRGTLINKIEKGIVYSAQAPMLSDDKLIFFCACKNDTHKYSAVFQLNKAPAT